MSCITWFRDSATVLEELTSPIDRRTAATQLADGELNRGELVAETPTDTFESVADLATGLPREAGGEPYRSEGAV